MSGVCTENVPRDGPLDQLIRFLNDLPDNPAKPTATLREDDVVVRVRTAAMAVHDTFKRKNVTKKPYIPPEFECCGEVVQTGRTVADEYPIGSSVVCFQSSVIPKPGHLTDEQAVAAMVPLRVATCVLSKQVYRAMSNEKPRTMVILLGASRAVGSVVLQAARHEWPQATLVAICSASKREFALRNGATKVIDNNEVSEWSLDRDVNNKTDVVLDLVGRGPESLRQGSQALRRGGVFNTTIGTDTFIDDGEHVSLWYFLGKLISLLWCSVSNLWRRSYKYYVRDMSFHSNMSLYNQLLFEDKAICPEVDWIIDIENVETAQEAIQRNQNMGQLVLRVAR